VRAVIALFNADVLDYFMHLPIDLQLTTCSHIPTMTHTQPNSNAHPTSVFKLNSICQPTHTKVATATQTGTSHRETNALQRESDT